MKTKVIAELGINHNGSPETAHDMIDTAITAGAHIIKFQHFYSDEVWLAAPPQEIGRCALSFETLSSLVDHVRRLKREVSIAPFGPKACEDVLKLKPNIIKIASGELDHYTLIYQIARALHHLPDIAVMISNGAHTPKEFAKAIHIIRAHTTNIIPTYCVSAYPTLLEDLDLSELGELVTGWYGTYDSVGFSDHTTDTLVPALAACMGATHIEKHFKLNGGCHDAAVSLGPIEFMEMCRFISVYDRIKYNKHERPLAVELKTRIATTRTQGADGIWRRPPL